jgi:DNA primase
VVAPLGTGLTAEQAALLARFTRQVILLYDADAAGLKATFRAGDELLRAGLRVSVATLPPGEDPDTLARRGGAAAVERILDDAVDLLERKLQLLGRKGWLGSVRGRRRALDRLLPTLEAAADAVTRDLYVGRVAEALGVSRGVIEGELGAAPAPRRAPAPPAAGAAGQLSGAVRDLLRVMVHEPEWRSRIAEQWADRSDLGEAGRAVFEALAREPAAPAAEVASRLSGEAQALLAGLLAEPWGPPDVDALVDGALRRLDSRRLEAELERIERALPFAPEAEKPDLMRRADSLSKQIRTLNPARWNVMRTGRSGAR